MLTPATTAMLAIWCLISGAFLSYAFPDIFWSIIKMIGLAFYIPFLLLQGLGS